MYGSRRRLVTTAVALGLTLTVGAAACGDDSDDKATGSDRPAIGSDASSGGTGDGGASNAAFCTDYAEITTAVGGFGMGPNPPTADEARAFYIDNLKEAIDRIAGHVPTAIDAEVAAMATALQELGTSGDVSALQSPDVATAQSIASGWVFDKCGFQAIEVMGADYSFDGIDSELDTGATVLRFMNHSTKELHEVQILAKADGVTESFDAILDLPMDEAFSKVEPVAFAFAPPGESAYAFANLDPGDYLAVCFIPEGTTMDTEGTGRPHFALGMKQAFTVK